MILGVAGKARSGKDTVAKYLKEKYKFNQHAFADNLRGLAYEINPLIQSDYNEVVSIGSNVNLWTIKRAEKSERTVGYIRLRDLLNDAGYEKAKEFKEVRKFYQDLGMSLRSSFGENFWIDQLWKEMEQKYGMYSKDLNVEAFMSNIIISDVRFENEAVAVRNAGGYVIKINRGDGDGDEHISEKDLPPHLINFTVPNIAGTDLLYENIEDILNAVGFVRPTGQVEGKPVIPDSLGTKTVL